MLKKPSSIRKKGPVLDGKIAGLYDLEETIGKGHFAVVKLARHVFTGEKVAVKVIDKTKLDEVSKSHLFQEVRCMKLVQHPHVVRLYEVIDTQTKLYLILELGDGGDMYDLIMKHGKGVDESFARKCFKQIVDAIAYCHTLHVVHRDLKPENVVFFEKLGIVKLTDFGFSNKFVPGKNLETSCGSLAYSAPEILLGDSYDPPAVDVWSLGVLLFMLVKGEPPFQEANDSETLTMIMDCRYQMPTNVSSECQNLISKLLNREPSNRPSLAAIIDHPWIADMDSSSSCKLPLISKEDLSEEEHNHIIMKMADGQIANKEAIISALERDEYDHITATYYLLAERRLKRQHGMEVTHLAGQRLQRLSMSGKPVLEPLALSPRIQPSVMTPEQLSHHHTIESLVSPPCGQMPPSPLTFTTTLMDNHSKGFAAGRRISLIKEESMEEDSDRDDAELDSVHKVKFAKSLEDCVSDDSESQSSSNEAGIKIRTRNLRRPHSTRSRPLHSVKSSPQLLNQIFEEGESEGDDDILPAKMISSHVMRRNHSVASPEVLRKFAHKLRKKRSGKRGASASSSDASDNDETEKRKRKEKLKHHFKRRDSSENSSDTDGPGGFMGGNQNGGSNVRSTQSGLKENNNESNSTNQNKQEGKESGGGKQQTLAPVVEQNEKLEVNDRMTERCDSRLSSNYSNHSNLSLSTCSLTSRGSKYRVDSTASNSPTTRRRKLSNDSMNNLFQLGDSFRSTHAHLIHVVSREFSDICEKLSRASSREGSIQSENVSVCSNDWKMTRKKSPLKVDINSNGLTDPMRDPPVTIARKRTTPECCNVV